MRDEEKRDIQMGPPSGVVGTLNGRESVGIGMMVMVDPRDRKGGYDSLQRSGKSG